MYILYIFKDIIYIFTDFSLIFKELPKEENGSLM